MALNTYTIECPREKNRQKTKAVTNTGMNNAVILEYLYVVCEKEKKHIQHRTQFKRFQVEQI